MDQFKPLENGMLIGPQPTDGNLRRARQEGVKTVIDFRMPSETSTPNAELVARSRLAYVNIPVNQASSLSLRMIQNFSSAVALSTGSQPRTDAHKVAQARTVVQSLLAGHIRQVEPLLDAVNAQHALPTNGGGAAVACVGIVSWHKANQSTMASIVATNLKCRQECLSPRKE